MEEGDLMIAVFALLLPLFFSVTVLLLWRRSESECARWVSKMPMANLLAYGLLLAGRIFNFLPEVVDLGSVLKEGDYSFELTFLLDAKALALMGLSTFLYAVIVKFSRVYLHREEGFKRFFRTLFLSQFGLNLIATAGTFSLLFVGWEVLGLTSFLLVSFYRDRATPIWNAFRVYIIYRVCDVGFLLAGFLSHHEFGGGHHFLNFEPQLMMALAAEHPGTAALLGGSILFAALGKSAQFPFSFWLPRALEGPTPSTAVFYGALSIHAGLFLLMRTQAYWMPVTPVRILVAAIGFVSLLIGTFAGRAQANIKGQIGYASVAQVGFMFMELAMGLDNFVLVHLISHAILRTYQFLTSPSVVTHFVRHPVNEQIEFDSGISSIPVVRRLAVGEFFLEEAWTRLLVRPLLHLADSLEAVVSLAGILLLGCLIMAPGNWSLLFLVFALMFSLCAIGSGSAEKAVKLIWLSVLLVILSGSILVGDHSAAVLCALGFLPGVLFWLVGQPSLRFLSWLCLAGFPITLFFVGEDLLIHQLSREGTGALALFFVIFVLNGVELARAFIRANWLASARPMD